MPSPNLLFRLQELAFRTQYAELKEQQDEVLVESFGELPKGMQAVVRKRLPALRRALAGHPQPLEQFEIALHS